MSGRPVDLFCIRVKIIIAKLIQDIYRNQRTTGEANSEANNIYKRIELVGLDIPPGYFEVVAKHGTIYFECTD